MNAVRLDDGRIAIIDGGSSEVRLFDADGRFVATFGGEGDGPGRFNAPRGVWQRADSLVVWDVQLRRTTVFPLDGGDPRVVVPIDVQINAGTFAYMVGDMLVATSNENRETGETTSELTTHYVTMPLDGGRPETLASMDAGVRTRVPLSFQGARIVAISPPVFSGELRHFVFGSSDAPQIRILETGDTTARIIRWESASIPVTPDRVETYTRTLVAGGGVEELVRGRLGGAGTAATFPHYSGPNGLG
jgi:hypothetical protein